MTEIDLWHAMSTLRAVRRHRPDPISDEVLGRVLQAAVWAPTGGNAQPWRVVAVRDTDKRRTLRDLYRDEWRRFSRGYDELLASIEDPARKGKLERILRAGDVLAENFHQSPVTLIFCFDPERMAITDADLGRPSVVGGASVYPSVQNCLLACRAEGLGCVLTTLLCYREAEVKRLLAIPDAWFTCAAIPLGYPAGGGHGPISRRPVATMAFLDTWGVPWTGSPAAGEGG